MYYKIISGAVDCVDIPLCFCRDEENNLVAIGNITKNTLNASVIPSRKDEEWQDCYIELNSNGVKLTKDRTKNSMGQITKVVTNTEI